MKRNIMLFYTFCFSFIAIAQNNQKASLTGIVQNKTDNKSIEYATVAIFSIVDSSFVSGTVTDGNGKFSISDIPFGSYYLVSEFIGFNKSKSKQFQLNTSSITKVENILLESNTENIAEIEVVVEKPFVTTSIDKKVYNAEQNATSSGGTALDILRNIPSVSVDQDGNVSLRGNSNVTILIDGKQTNLTGGGRQALLEQIPASNIEDIELVTNPSAKYDPDGLSGIINIVLKKNKLEGINGSFSLTAGNNWKDNLNAQLSYKNEKWNVYGNYSFNYNNRNSSSNSFRESIFDSLTTILDQHSTGIRVKQTHMVKGGFDYNINKNNIFSFGTTLNNNTHQHDDILNFKDSIPNELIYNRDRISTENRTGMSIDINFAYSKKFKKKGETLDFSFNNSESSSIGNNDNNEHIWDKNNVELYFPKLQNTSMISNNIIRTTQLDYVHPYKENIKFETGLKNTNRSINNNFYSESNALNQDSLQYEVLPDSLLINQFNYKESISAAYLMSNWKISKKWSALGGLRAEQTYTTSTLVNTNQVFNNEYFSLFPSASLNYVILDSAMENANITASYSRRINRPSVETLNPFTDYSNPQNLRRGNPFLKPEYIDSYELSYSKFKKGISFNTSGYFKYTNDLIQRTITYNEDRSVTIVQQENVGTSRTYGLEFSVGGKITPWWRIMLSGNGFFSQTRGTLSSVTNEIYNLNNDAFGFTSNLNSNFKIKKNYDLQVTSWYNAPMYFAQGKIKSMKSIDLSLKRKVLKEKGEISLRLADIFDTQEFGIDLNISNVKENKLHDWESRNVFLGFSYRFGKETSNRRKSKNNHNEGDFNGGSGGGM